MTDPIKKYLCATNEWLAAYVNTSIDQIESVRSHSRMLEVHHMLAFQKIIDALELDLPVGELATVQEYVASENIDLRDELQKCERKLERLKIKNQQLASQRDTYLRGLHACKRLLASAKLTTEESTWILKRRNDLLYRLGQVSVNHILLLEAEITALEVKVGVLRDGLLVG